MTKYLLSLGTLVLATAVSLPAAELPSKDDVTALADQAQTWILAQQLDDGSFVDDGRFKVGGTVLAIEALTANGGLGADHPAIKKGLGFLVQYQQPDGGVYDPNTGLANYITSLTLMTYANLGDAAEPKIDITAAQNFLLGLQNTDPNDINEGGIGYGSSGPSHEDLNNTTFAVEALRRSGIPADHEAMQRALKFIERCQNRSESNDMGWAGNDGGGVYAPHQSKAGGSWSEEQQAQKAVEQAMETNTLRSYGTMTYNLISSFIALELPKDDPRLLAALEWAKQNYQFEVNPGMPEGQEMEGLIYYYQMLGKTFDLMEMTNIELESGATDWRADLFAAIQGKAQQADGGGTFFINAAERWGEGSPIIATPYLLKTLRRIQNSL